MWRYFESVTNLNNSRTNMNYLVDFIAVWSENWHVHNYLFSRLVHPFPWYFERYAVSRSRVFPVFPRSPYPFFDSLLISMQVKVKKRTYPSFPIPPSPFRWHIHESGTGSMIRLHSMKSLAVGRRNRFEVNWKCPASSSDFYFCIHINAIKAGTGQEEAEEEERETRFQCDGIVGSPRRMSFLSVFFRRIRTRACVRSSRGNQILRVRHGRVQFR